MSARPIQVVFWLIAGLAFVMTTGWWLDGTSDPTWRIVAAAFGTAAMLACVAFAGASLASEPAADRLGLVRAELAPGTFVLLVLGALGSSHLLESTLDGLGLTESGSLAEFEEALTGIGGLRLAASLITLGLMAPLAEELLFRGLLQRGLARPLGDWAALAVASLAFGVAHGAVGHASAAFMLGLYFGAATLFTGSIVPAIVCHVANNLIATLTAGVVIPGWVGLVGCVAGPLTGFLALRALGRAWVERRRLERSRPDGSVVGGELIGQDVTETEDHREQPEPDPHR